MMSEPGPPLMRSLPAPPSSVSLPGPPDDHVAARVAEDGVVAAAAVEVVVAGAPGDPVVAAAAVDHVGPGRAREIVAARRPGHRLGDDGAREGEQGDDDEGGGTVEHAPEGCPSAARRQPHTPSSHGLLMEREDFLRATWRTPPSG